MNKGDLVNLIAEKAEITKKAAGIAIDTMLEGIMNAVAAGDKCTMIGFGTFEPRERQSRQGRNPVNGKPIQIPASRVPGFSSGKEFKARVAKK